MESGQLGLERHLGLGLSQSLTEDLAFHVLVAAMGSVPESEKGEDL